MTRSGQTAGVMSHDDLRVLARDVLLKVVLTEQDALCLRVVVEVEGHLADAALEAEFVKDASPSLNALRRVDRLRAHVTLLVGHYGVLVPSVCRNAPVSPQLQ